MKNINAALLFLFVIGFAGCASKNSINKEQAGKVITDYLIANPEYKTTRFNFGEVKFNSKSEMLDLLKYKALANKGMVAMSLLSAKKKFLSKDSSFVYQIKLTEQASALVLKQSDDKATVKTVNYVLADSKPVDFSMVNSNTAKVTVSLKKENTDFAPFDSEKYENSNFITKTYKLKFDKDEGWKVQN
ncbi:hypothetical protein ABIB40_003435 [Pedobacter sp. UYP30]|uniref:hypothetical protein n=1 Tax=Pedobacter sp. UYP30 TaxID=1756400 RepID=UPI00339B17AB